jgi:hypothetical protein
MVVCRQLNPELGKTWALRWNWTKPNDRRNTKGDMSRPRCLEPLNQSYFNVRDSPTTAIDVGMK